MWITIALSYVLEYVWVKLSSTEPCRWAADNGWVEALRSGGVQKVLRALVGIVLKEEEGDLDMMNMVAGRRDIDD